MLCELLTLKKRLGIAEADVVDDDLLTRIINAVGGRFALECNRTFDFAEEATFVFRADEMNVCVDRFPIVEVAGWELKETEAAGFVAATEPDFIINPTRSIIELSSCLGTSRQMGRVTFSGGYVLPGATAEAGQTALPAEIKAACVEQSAFWYQRRNQLGLASVSGEGGSIAKDPVSVVKPLSLLPTVAAVLVKYERWRN